MFWVISSANLEGSRAFYERLGYSFAEEQHGSGPRHFSTTLAETLFELYPPLKSLGDEPSFIGIYVDGDADAVKQDLIENFGGKEPEPAIPTTQSGIASLRDPGGHLVRLFPRPV